jgi:hypothetical protein
MRERDGGVCRAALPTQRPQLWHPILTGRDQEPAMHSHAFPSVLIRVGQLNCQREQARKRGPVLDHTRFTAGIVGLYEAVLSEPLPLRMLRLIEQIGTQEHRS